MCRGAVYVVLALCAWSVLTFGAVYQWGYWTLAIGAMLLCVGLSSRTIIRSRIPRELLMMPMAVLFAAVALQLLPLPATVLEVLSPSTLAVLRQYDLGYSLSPTVHSLSIEPAATRLALLLGITFAGLMLLTASLLSIVGARKLVGGLAVVGVVVALIGIIQRPFFSGQIYGFWEPEHRSNSFGPFVNPNHFAGWMAMSLSLTMGLMCAQFAHAMRRGARTWRDYIAWASGPQASGLALLMTAALTMGLALVLSLSRAGILCFLLAILMTAYVTLRKQRGTRRLLAIAYLIGLVILVFSWVGPTTVAGEFENSSSNRLGGRLGPWTDALSVFRSFPVAGTGLNTYGTAMLFYQHHNLGEHYGAAHNDYLHLAAEGGLLLGIPAAWAIVALVRAIRRRFQEDVDDTETYWIRVGAATGLIAIALQEGVDFSLQIPGCAFLFALLCAVAIHHAPRAA